MSRLVVLLLLLGPTAAVAQDAGQDQQLWFDAHHLFVNAYDGDLRDPLRLNRPGRTHQWDWFVGGVFEYANSPLVRYDVTPDGTKRTNVLDNIVALNLSGGVSFHERFRLDVAFPLYFASFDANNAYQGVDMGDIRFTAMVPILLPNEDDEGFGLAAFGHLDAPSGSNRQFLGNRTVSGGGSLGVSYAIAGFTVSGEAGVHFQPTIELDNLSGSDRFVAGLGIGYLVHETTSLNLEANIEASFTKSRVALTQAPMEMTLTVRHRRPMGLNILGGAAAGITRGAGAARFRVFVGLGFGKITEPPPKDADGDGILDDVDACPEEPETFNEYKDEDGCPDDLADLTVRALLDGQPIEGAEIEISKAGTEEMPERMVSKVEPRPREGLMPGTTYDGVARMGACLAGDASISLDEGANSLDIPMRPVRGAKVVYELVGPDGKPVTDAVATWRTDAPGCADREGYSIPPDGHYEHPIGAGTHTVFIDAPGFRIYRENITIAPGDVYVIKTTMKPTKVQVDRKEIKILEKVYFEFNSDKIKAESYELLDEVADTIIANDVGRVLVEGHTDSKGSDSYNLELSDRRAASVRTYLIGRGVNADQLIAKGFGESRPVATNATEAGRAKNRRVVFTLIDRDEQYIEVEEGK
ncbi:MAG: OmpA family protein [Alphaproteobacteria bacterium]|nr:OmpA family protein [Alphaproteobacteria bacterium]